MSVNTNLNLVTGITRGTLPDFFADSRKLANWFKGGIAGKTVVWWGDSTTEQLAGITRPITYTGSDVTVSRHYPALAGTKHYNYGATGATLAVLLSNPPTNAGGNVCGVNAIAALNPAVVILSGGINDYRANASIAGASYVSSTSTANAAAISGAQGLQTLLVQAITQLTAAIPGVVIILRMPNAFNAAAGGGAQTYFTQTGVSSQNVQDVLRLAYRGDPNTSTPIPQLNKVYSNVLIWDAQATVFPETAFPNPSPLIAAPNDNLHPVEAGYFLILSGLLGLLVPQNDAGTLLNTSQTNTSRVESTLSGGVKAINNDTSAPFDASDWYPVYSVNLVAFSAGSFTDISFNSSDATAALNAFGSASVGPGIAIGDVFVFNQQGTFYAVPVQQRPDSNQGGGTIRWFSGPGFSPSNQGLSAGLATGSYGFLYRHKYAFSQPARLIIAGNGAVPLYNSLTYKNFYRFMVVSAANGSITISSIANETAANGQQVHQHTLTTSDSLCLAGAEGTGATIAGMSMASASAGAVANQQFTITLAGTDFRNFIGGQGFLCSST